MEEAKDKKVVFTFGRFQPPTSGHQLLIEKVQQVAKKLGAEHRIYPSPSYDAKKNPLSHSDKVKYMKKMFKGANIMNDKKMINPFKVAEQLNEQGYTHVTMVVGSDRVNEFKKAIGKYVGPDGYNFKFNVVSAGKRDPDAEGVVGMSGSKMRQAVKDNDLASFSKGVPVGVNKRDIQGLFKAIKKGMGLKERKILSFVEHEEYALFEEKKKILREPEILDRLVQQLQNKGMSKDKAFAIANSQLQKNGVLKKGSQELTDKGKKRNSMSPAERAKDRAAKKSGRSTSEYKYNEKTNTATLKGFKESTEQELDELTRQARMKMSRTARRTAKKRAKTRKRKEKRIKSGETLVAKSQKAARNVFRTKFLRGKQWSKLSHSEKEKIDQRIKKINPKKLKAIQGKLLPGIRKSERERIASLRDLKDKPGDVGEESKRDYKKEYANFHGKPEQRAKRSKRVLARRKLESQGRVKKGDGKDVDHKDGNANNNSDSNLRVLDRHTNRSRNNNK
jgi:hypothetical protein